MGFCLEGFLESTVLGEGSVGGPFSLDFRVVSFDLQVRSVGLKRCLFLNFSKWEGIQQR